MLINHKSALYSGFQIIAILEYLVFARPELNPLLFKDIIFRVVLEALHFCLAKHSWYDFSFRAIMVFYFDRRHDL